MSATKTAAQGEMRMNERGKTAALKMKTPRSYSEVPRWGLAIMQDAAKCRAFHLRSEAARLTHRLLPLFSRNDAI